VVEVIANFVMYGDKFLKGLLSAQSADGSVRVSVVSKV